MFDKPWRRWALGCTPRAWFLVMGSHIGAACTGDRVTCQTVAMFEGLKSVSRDGQFVKTGRIEPVCQFPRSATINV